MKKSKLFLALALMFSIGLVGCKKSANKPAPEPVPVEPADPEPVEPVEEPKTVEDVVTDINAVFNPLVGSDIMTYYEEYGCYIGGLNLGPAEATEEEAHIAELQGAAETVASYLPEYLVIGAATYETDYDDYYIGLSVDKVGVALFGYVNNDNVIVQIQIAELLDA